MNQSQYFDIRVWLDEATTYASSMSWQGQIKVVSTVAPNNTATLVKSEYTADFGTDTSNANTPNIVDNLIPVVYDEANYQWVKTNTSQSNWYNYTTQTWANAVTTTAQTRALYNAADTGTIIPMADILGMYVWIFKIRI